MRDRSEHEQSESSLRAESSKMARPSEGKPQDLQRKGRTITASHGTLAGSINSRHGLLYCDVACVGVANVVRSAVKCSSGNNLGVSGGVGAVMVCALRVNWSSLLCSACVRRAPCLRLGCEPREQHPSRLDFRHAPSNVAAASRFDSLEDTQDVILPPYTTFKMPLGRFARLGSHSCLLKS